MKNMLSGLIKTNKLGIFNNMRTKKRIKDYEIKKGRGHRVIRVFKNYFKSLNDKTLLDVGCGHGNLTVEFAKEFKSVHAVDTNPQRVEKTQNLVKKRKLDNVSLNQENALKLKTNKSLMPFIYQACSNGFEQETLKKQRANAKKHF